MTSLDSALQHADAGDSYFRQAALLRWCLEYNLDDHYHAQDGGRIVYLADANIVLFFTNPDQDKEFVTVFGAGKADEYATGTALITAEYIFSRELPGQRASPILIAPAHGEDLQDVFTAKERDIEAPSAEPLIDGTPEQLRQLIQQVRNRQIGRPEAIAGLRKLVPNVAEHVLGGSYLQQGSQLLRLYNNDLLRPLTLHPDATRDILQLDHQSQARVGNWIERLQQHRSPRREGRPQHSSHTLARDAEALVQTMLLDEAAILKNDKTRYVLVTADMTLFDAYVKWYWCERTSAEENARFVLRLPLQYAPILNVQDMPNGITHSDIILSARDALDGLFVNTTAFTDGYPKKLAYHRTISTESANVSAESNPSGQPFAADERLKTAFREIRRFWRESFSNGIVLNADLMQRRLREEFSVLAHLLREDADFLTALHDDQQRIIMQVFTAHASVTTRLNLRTLTMNDPSSGRIQRAPLILRKYFPAIVSRGSRLDDTLTQLALYDQAMIDSVEEKLNAAPRHEALFFAACVAHRCRHWQAARLFSEWAQSSLPPTSELDRRDLVYLTASATRYEFSSPGPIIAAFSSLSELIRFARLESDHFGLARALCERASLMMAALFRARLQNEQDARSVVRALSKHVPSLSADLEAAAESLDKVAAQDPATLELKIHINANIISAFLFVRNLQQRPFCEEPRRTSIDRAVAELNPIVIQDTRPIILKIEHVLARHALGQATFADVEEILNCPQIAEATSSKSRLRLDEAEIRFFRAWISTNAQNSGLTGDFAKVSD